MDELRNYARCTASRGCFDTIIEIKKAIREKDEATAFMALGELREQIVLLDTYISSLEETSASSTEQAPAL